MTGKNTQNKNRNKGRGQRKLSGDSKTSQGHSQLSLLIEPKHFTPVLPHNAGTTNSKSKKTGFTQRRLYLDPLTAPSVGIT